MLRNLTPLKSRWFIYIIIGIVFGVFDFYYQAFIQNSFKSSFAAEHIWLVWLLLIVGIWLVPSVPIVLNETNVSQSKILSALANSLLWCASIISYYLINAVQLAFLGATMRPELQISNHTDRAFWVKWKYAFLHEILWGIIEWAVVAVVGGFIVGFLISFIYLYSKSRVR